MATGTKSMPASCSFCGERQEDVARLIAGPGVYICGECVRVCDQLLATDPSVDFKDYADQSEKALLKEMVRVHSSHAAIDEAVATIVRHLRSRNVAWARIGEALGMTRQSAWERFSGEE